MKRFLIIFISTLMAALGLLPLQASATPGDNLIANESMETEVNATTPEAWISDAWGTNVASFSYLDSGHTGSRSVKTEVTSYTDGDAKWYFNPVTITPGSTYNFSDYYQANVATEVVVQYTNEDDVTSYQWLGTVSASEAWMQAAHTFTVPADARKVSVFHVVPSLGWLVIDDANLSENTTPPPPPSTNLVVNPSVEQAVAGIPIAPEAWVSNKWGTNTTTFDYLSTGHGGERSVKTQVTDYTDGDAKWYFNPVTITPGTQYEYTDYYQSNVATDIFAWFISEDGSNSYQWLGTASANSGWHQATFSFAAPANTQKVSIFHTVSSVGWLVLDDVSLGVAAQAPANPVPNPSLEQPSAGDPDIPDQWVQNSWGTNNASFAYLNEGYTGSRSVKTTVSNYTDGDAKWYFAPQTLQRDNVYRFSVRYKTDTAPHVALMHVRADGSEYYRGMPDPVPSGNTSEWQLFSDTFTVPADAALTSVFLYVSGNGWVQTDDYNLEIYEPEGFNRPLVTLTFDDGEEENVTTALPVLNSHSFKSTQCFATDHVEGTPENSQHVLTFKNNGHEICSHTVSHPFLTQLTPEQVEYELTHSKEVLENLIGGPVHNFASPYGDYNSSVNSQIQQHYRSHRTVDEGYNSKDNFNIYRIRVQNMLSTTTIQEYQKWLDYAEATNTWLVLVYHRITPTDPGPFDTYTTNFSAQMQALADSGLTVKTYNDALDEVVPQL